MGIMVQKVWVWVCMLSGTRREKGRRLKGNTLCRMSVDCFFQAASIANRGNPAVSQYSPSAYVDSEKRPGFDSQGPCNMIHRAIAALSFEGRIGLGIVFSDMSLKLFRGSGVAPPQAYQEDCGFVFKRGRFFRIR